MSGKRKPKPLRRPRRAVRKRAQGAGQIPFPIAMPGMRVGLFGGSFNPPHEAHRAASVLALKRLGLDRVWWLVTPGNPLKENRALPSLSERLALARKVGAHPAIDVTGIEARLGTTFTADTVAKLQARFPQVHFVLVIGADNLAQFHRWKNWQRLARAVPIAVIDRPDYELPALAGPAARAFAHARLEEANARVLPLLQPPAWVFLHGLKSELSSTALRAADRRKG